MPISRRSTPPTSQIKEQHNVLDSLSAWTDDGDGDDKAKKKPLLDPDELGEPTFRKKLAMWLDVESESFNIAIGAVIILNSVIIGIEVELAPPSSGGHSDTMPAPSTAEVVIQVLQGIFNIIFLIEMIMRIRQLGRAYFEDVWNWFDAFLVFVGCLDLVTGNGSATVLRVFRNVRMLRMMRVLRVIRVIRVLRVFRLFRMFHQLHLIMQAFFKAFQIVALISILVIILDYVCAIILTQSMALDPDARVTAYFSSLPVSMASLFRIMTLTNWDEISSATQPAHVNEEDSVKVLNSTNFTPAIIQHSTSDAGSGVIFFCFVCYIMVTAYTMISLITGIISESLITSQQEHARRKLEVMEDKKREVANYMRETLIELNEDSVDSLGSIDADDMKTSVRGDTELLAKLATCGITIDETGLLSLIDKLGQDNTVRLNIEYFINKLTNLNGPASASSLCDLKYSLVKFHQKLDTLAGKVSPEDKIFEAPKPEAPEPVKVLNSDKPEAVPKKRSSVKKDGPIGGVPGVHKTASLRFEEPDGK